MRLILTFILSLFCFQKGIANPSSMVFLGSREGDPESLIQNVSTINGDYSEIEVDLIVPGPDPLILSRFYSSQDDRSLATFGGWRFCPQCVLFLERDPSQHYTTLEGIFYLIYARVGTVEGSILTYTGWNSPQVKSLLKPDMDHHLFSLANTARKKIGSWTNLKNNILKTDPQKEAFELTLCNGGKRFYYKHPTLNLYLLQKEILPSGNKIFYEYSEKPRFILIKLTNSKEDKTLSWIKIDNNQGVYVETSDGQTVDYQFDQNSFLVKVIHSQKPPLTYHYQETDSHPLLIQKELPEGRIQMIKYTQESPYRVVSITLPEGDVTSFAYEEGVTTIQDSLGRKRVHRYDDDLKLIAIEEYLEKTLYRTCKKFWGKKKNICNLISQTMEDGAGQTLFAKTYTYDDCGNILEEKEYGNLTGVNLKPLQINEEGIPYEGQEFHTKRYTYDTIDDIDIVTQIDAKKNSIRYSYKKGTDLLLKKSILTEDVCKKRWFYDYNEDGVLTQLIIDDGNDAFKKFLYLVSQRAMTTITPKKDPPNVGAPKIIEEKYLDLETEQETLLKKTVNHFDLHRNITFQEVYDGEESHLYSLHKAYNKQGLLALETDLLGYQTKYSYDANHNLISIENEKAGITFEYKYDLKNRPIYSTQKSQSMTFETQTTYDPYGNVLSRIDPMGNCVQYIYDTLGRIQSISHPQIIGEKGALITPITTYTYDIFDNPTSITDQNGNVTKISYTSRKTPIKIEHPDGTSEFFKYDPEGTLYQYCGRDGIIQVFEYDYLGRVSYIESYERGITGRKNGFKRKYCTYNAFHLTSEEDKGRYETFSFHDYSYDGAGRLKSMTKETQKIEYFYNSQGRVSKIKTWKSQNDFTLQVLDYDLQGNLIQKHVKDSQGNILLKSKYTYDSSGRLKAEIGYPQNQETILKEYEYDPFGRPLKITDPFNQTKTIHYDDHYTNFYGKNVLKTVEIDVQGNLIEKIYNAMGNLEKIYKKNQAGDLLFESESFFDPLGNELTQKTQVFSPNLPPKEYKIKKSYTPFSLLHEITFAAGTSFEKTISYTYNAYGNLSSYKMPGATAPVTYEYRNNARLKKLIVKDPFSQEEVIYKVGFDARGNQTQIELEKTFCLSYQFDANDQLIQESIRDEWGFYQVKCTFDGEGNITTIELPDKSLIEYTYQGPLIKTITRLSKEKKKLYQYRAVSYDLMGNLLEEILPGHVGTRYQSYDRGGRKTKISTDFFQETIPEGGYDTLSRITKRNLSLLGEKYTIQYDYDALSQLILEKGPIENTYTYDSIGNRLEKNGKAYTISDFHELMQGEDISCTYNSSGNLISKKQGDQRWKFEYNGLGQLISIKNSEGTQLLLTYDIHGKRLSKTLKKQGSKPKIFRIFYLGSIEIGSLNEKGEIYELKVPSNPNILSQSIAFEIQKETYVPLYDLLGNVSCLIDPERRVVLESYQYSAFGEEKIISRRGSVVKKSSVENPWRYQNSRIDENSSLIYLNTCYYDRGMGRWINPDPFGDLDSPNLYVYCRNNPLTYRLAATSNQSPYFWTKHEPSCHASIIPGNVKMKK